MVKLCLSRLEIAELARARTRKRQAEFLRANGILHYVDNHGWPVVPRSAIEGRGSVAQDVKHWKPRKAT